jgi:hypothetical protein
MEMQQGYRQTAGNTPPRFAFQGHTSIWRFGGAILACHDSKAPAIF